LYFQSSRMRYQEFTRWLLAYVLSVCATVSLFGQTELICTPDARQVEIGYTIGVTFTLMQGEADRFVAPDFDGFKVVSGPKEGYNTNFREGKLAQSETWTYMLMPTKVGLLTIGEAVTETSQGNIHSKPFQLLVTSQSLATGSALALAKKGERIFIQAKLSADTVFIGQGVRLDHTLHTLTPVESFHLLEDVTYPQCYTRDLRRLNTQNGEKSIGKQTYAVRLLRAVSLVPQQIGTFELPASNYQLGVQVNPDQPAPRDRYNRPLPRAFKSITVPTLPVSLVVQPLPSDAPAAFTGLVGNYAITAEVDQPQITTADAVRLTIRLTGDGDPRQFKSALAPYVEGLEIYAPKLAGEESWESDNRGFFHETILEYSIVPKRAGDFIITPEVVVFDPTIKDYRTLKAETIKIAVKLSTGAQVWPSKPDVIMKNTSKHLRGVLLWLSLGLLVTAFVVFLARRRKINLSETSDWLPKAQSVLQTTTPIDQVDQEGIDAGTAHHVVAKKTSNNGYLIDVGATTEVFYRQVADRMLSQLGADGVGAAINELVSTGGEPARQCAQLLGYCQDVLYGAAQPKERNEEFLSKVEEVMKQLSQ
jgi:BatD DUF11 like domain